MTFVLPYWQMPLPFVLPKWHCLHIALLSDVLCIPYWKVPFVLPYRQVPFALPYWQVPSYCLTKRCLLCCLTDRCLHIALLAGALCVTYWQIPFILLYWHLPSYCPPILKHWKCISYCISCISCCDYYPDNCSCHCSGLSKWVRQKMQYFNMFHNAHQSLQQFTVDRCSKPSIDEPR